jgi:hypothetical protein
LIYYFNKKIKKITTNEWFVINYLRLR